LPSVEGSLPLVTSNDRKVPKIANDGQDRPTNTQHTTITRPRNEPKEDKRLRKQAAKAERQIRRVEKKQNADNYDAEFKRQSQSLAAKQAAKARKL
jgi:protein LTV1